MVKVMRMMSLKMSSHGGCSFDGIDLMELISKSERLTSRLAVGKAVRFVRELRTLRTLRNLVRGEASV